MVGSIFRVKEHGEKSMHNQEEGLSGRIWTNKSDVRKKGRDYMFNCRIPAELFIGCDETNVRFFNHTTRTREVNGVMINKLNISYFTTNNQLV